MVRLIVLVAAALALMGASVLAVAAYLRVDEVRLPDLRGTGFERATALVRELGLRPVTFQELDAGADPDAVVSQSPIADSTVRRGRTVRLGVNALAEARQAPTVVGLRERDAVARATSVNVPVVRVSYLDSDRPSGTVVRQDPEPGARLGAAEGLHLTVSRGLAATAMEMPDLRGSTLEEARHILSALGIRLVDEVAAALSFDRPFTVTDQRPVAGSPVVASTPVTLVYALEGTRVVRVPEVVGEPLWRAQLQLRAARLAIGPVQEIDDPTRPVGVVEVRPDGYTVVGSPVALVVNGPVPEIDRSPLVGIDTLPTDFRDATPVAPRIGGGDAGAEPGLEPGVEPRAQSQAEIRPGSPPRPEEPDGIPAPGTTVEQADGSRLIPFRFDPAQVGVVSLTREPYRLRLVVVDDRGERVVLDQALAAGEAVALSVQVFGVAPLLQTFVNDSFFQAWSP